MAALQPLSANVDVNAVTQLELFISARKLPNKDSFSKSDPFVVVEIQDVIAGDWKEVDRSEVLTDNLNPDFQKMFLLDYFFEEQQTVRIRVFDSDSKSDDLSKHDLLGISTFQLSELVSAPGQTLNLPLMNAKGKIAKKDSVVIVRGEETSASKDLLRVAFRGEKLDKKDFFGKSDPYLEFYRLREDGTWTKTHTSEIIRQTLNPTWQEMVIPMQKFCNGDKQRPILIKCFDWDKDGTSDFIGSCEASVSDMMSSRQFRMELVNDELKKKNKKYRNSGALIVSSISIETVPSFLDYIKGGCNVSLMVAIDFTGSNGDPSMPGTLHFRDPHGWNQYQQAIRTIGNILAPYDSDQMFPVWGFGGRIFGEVNHCFALTFNENAPEVQGVAGILQVYNEAFKNVTLSGPTLFSQIIGTATSIVDQPYSQDKQHYGILLILTDGVINDMAGTIASINRASKTPLSIIIVGVGDADFKDMEKLDGDEEAASSKYRDIVQFVPMNKFSKSHISMLAKETLAEVPNQFLSFMKSKNIKPNPPRKAAAVSPSVASSVDAMSPSFSASVPAGEESPNAPSAPPAFNTSSTDDNLPPAFDNIGARGPAISQPPQWSDLKKESLPPSYF